MNGPKPRTVDELASDEFFDYHACVTGDCPHSRGTDCLRFAFKAGYDVASSKLAEARAENERLMNVEYWPERARNAERKLETAMQALSFYSVVETQTVAATALAEIGSPL